MVHIYMKKNKRILLYTLAKEFCFDAGRFADETSDLLKSIFPMKELFITYVDAKTNQLSFHHGTEVSLETISFYQKYPIEIFSKDYMARAVLQQVAGEVVIENDAIDFSSESDLSVRSYATTKLKSGTMALSLLATPRDFSSHAKQQNPFLKSGFTAITIYGDQYCDSYAAKEKKLFKKYLHCLRMGFLNSDVIAHEKMNSPQYKGKSVFSL